MVPTYLRSERYALQSVLAGFTGLIPLSRFRYDVHEKIRKTVAGGAQNVPRPPIKTLSIGSTQDFIAKIWKIMILKTSIFFWKSVFYFIKINFLRDEKKCLVFFNRLVCTSTIPLVYLELSRNSLEAPTHPALIFSPNLNKTDTHFPYPTDIFLDVLFYEIELVAKPPIPSYQVYFQL